ncbi:C40 family peptidase [Rhodococcus sp. MEB064]|uniref:C40 family peptidase n=1 Tax=Rhodococcus sp. MEB064 TaxID=1587522 RepID=UPI0005AC6B20|nr:C40 family peptidase [Rhodococcus sp. MEB064]KIQ19541.1 hypothetical protein RU01_03750 [Rhodococcus sp. MEB064]
MIDVLAAPIEDLLRCVATEDSVDSAVRTGDRHVAGAVRAATDASSALSGVWTGTAADAALSSVRSSIEAGTALIAHAGELEAAAAEATESIARGRAELSAVLSSFLSAAGVLLPAALTPAGQTALVALAAEHLERATVVYARVRAELDALAARVAALVLPEIPRPTSAIDAIVRSFVSPTQAATVGDFQPFVDPQTSGATAPGHRAYDPADGGTGTSVTLPDGSTSLAPNSRAASAVRFALDQQGTPYVWGGTTPGQGLDCSGLTQSAYQHAGVDIPRLASDQSVGTPVDVENVMPGDLAVWDGHVAMVVGNGQMVEAGDPVSVSPIRTSNSGMGFHGFYRPTA